jgi:aryl-alcohol dehydrogenase-like predicted oxidoreductase
MCKANDIQVICYSPLMQGLLTGRWTKTSEISEYRCRTRHFNSKSSPKSRHGEEGHEDLLWKAIGDCKKICDDAGLALADVANAWPLHQEGITCVIIGATKEEQVKSNAAAMNLKLEPSMVEALNAATEELKQAMGSHADIYESVAGQRVM